MYPPLKKPQTLADLSDIRKTLFPMVGSEEREEGESELLYIHQAEAA
jgi:hypothetical protein